MIAQADLGGSGETNCDEFYRIMKAKGNFLEDLSFDDDLLLALDLRNCTTENVTCSSHSRNNLPSY